MAAAVVTSLPTLRRFFLSILTWLNVQDKAQLWEDVKVHLLNEKEAETENDVLHSLQEMLHEDGSSLERLSHADQREELARGTRDAASRK